MLDKANSAIRKLNSLGYTYDGVKWAAPQAPSQAEPADASLWTLQGHRLATSGKAAWACRAFDPDAGEGGSWSEWRLTSYEPPRRPDRWFEVVALPALAGQQSERPILAHEAALSGEYHKGYLQGQREARIALAAATPPTPEAEPVQQDTVISMKRSEWLSLSPEAQARLQQIVGAGSRAMRLADAQAAQDMRHKPLLATPPAEKQAAPSGEDNHG